MDKNSPRQKWPNYLNEMQPRVEATQIFRQESARKTLVADLLNYCKIFP